MFLVLKNDNILFAVTIRFDYSELHDEFILTSVDENGDVTETSINDVYQINDDNFGL